MQVSDPQRIGRRRRSAASLANDERILDAAVLELAGAGFDEFSLQKVSRTVGLRSASGVYNRFENASELALATWERRLREPFAALVADAAGLLDDPSPARAERLAETVSHPDPWLVAALSVLAATHRDPFVDEVAGRDIRLLVEAHPAYGDRSSRACLLGSLAAVFGPTILSLSSSTPRGDWRDFYLAHGRLDVARTTYPGSAAAIAPPLLDVTTTDPIRDDLVLAYGHLLGEVGLKRATVGRVSRRIDYSTGVVYERYPDRGALVGDAVRVLLRAYMTRFLRRTAASAADGTLVRDLAGTLRGIFAADWRWFERFRLETHIAAAHDARVAEVVGDLHRDVLEHGVDQMGGETAEAPGALAATVLGFRAVVVGLCFLDAVVGGVGDLDWRPYVVPFVEER